METPFFPQWRHRLAPFSTRLRKVRQATLSELEFLFAGIFPPHLLAQAERRYDAEMNVRRSLRDTLAGRDPRGHGACDLDAGHTRPPFRGARDGACLDES